MLPRSSYRSGGWKCAVVGVPWRGSDSACFKHVCMYACVSPANQYCAKVAACLNIYIYIHTYIYIYIYMYYI